MTDSSRSFNIYTSDTLTLKLEYTNSLAILHCLECSKLNKAVLKEINETVFELFMLVKTVGFENLHAAIPEDDTFVNRWQCKQGSSSRDFSGIQHLHLRRVVCHK